MDRRELIGFLHKYRYGFMVLICGILLMSIPAPKEETKPEPLPVYETTLEETLSQLLSQVEGAGKVKVLLSQQCGENMVYQQNENSSDSLNASVRLETVILTSTDRSQNGLVCRVEQPVYRGAIVLCQGCSNPTIRLQITEAVANATGLGFDKISILKMK